MDFRMDKMTVIDGGPNNLGNRLLAVFDLHIAGMVVGGCVLVEKADGRISATGPHGKTDKGHKLRVTVNDKDLRRAITERASRLYEASTGRTLGANINEAAE